LSPANILSHWFGKNDLNNMWTSYNLSANMSFNVQVKTIFWKCFQCDLEALWVLHYVCVPYEIFILIYFALNFAYIIILILVWHIYNRIYGVSKHFISMYTTCSVSNTIVICILSFTPYCSIASQLSKLFEFSFMYVCMCVYMHICTLYNVQYVGTGHACLQRTCMCIYIIEYL